MKETIATVEHRYALIAMIAKKSVELTEQPMPIDAFDYLCSLNEEGLRDINDFVDMQLFVKALVHTGVKGSL
jgi:hypothetical protein